MNRLALGTVVIIALSCLFVNGCWSRREIESLGFATVIALDKAEDAIELTVQFAVTEAAATKDLGEEGSGGDTPMLTISTQADDLAKAIADMSTFLGKQPFWAHTRIILIGEELAQQGISPFLDYFVRNRGFRFSTWVMVSEGAAKDLLQVAPGLCQSPAEQIAELSLLSENTAFSAPRTLFDLLKQTTKGVRQESVLPLLKLRRYDTTPEAATALAEEQSTKQEKLHLTMTGMAVFQGDRMIAKLNALEARALLWLRGETKRSEVAVALPGGGYVVQRQLYGRRTLSLVREGGVLKAKITVHQDGDLIEDNRGQLTAESPSLDRLDELLQARILEEVLRFLDKMQTELKVDLLGLGDRVYRQYPGLYRELDWSSYFPAMPIEVEVKASFRRTGETLSSLFSE